MAGTQAASHPVGPRTRARTWVPVLAAFVVGAIAYAGLYCFPPISVAYAKEFGISRTLAVTPWTIFLLVTGLSSPLLGRAYDVIADRWLLAAGLLMMAAGWGVAVLASDVGLLVVAYGILLAVGLELVFVGTTTAISRRYAGMTGLALGIAYAGPGAGVAIALPLVTPAIPGLGWREILAVFGILSLAGLPFVWLMTTGPAILVPGAGGPARGRERGPGTAGRSAATPARALLQVAEPSRVTSGHRASVRPGSRGPAGRDPDDPSGRPPGPVKRPACMRPPSPAPWVRPARSRRPATRAVPTPCAARSAPPGSGSCSWARSRSARWTRACSRPSCPMRPARACPRRSPPRGSPIESVSYIVGQLVGGALSDRLGRRSVGLAALLVVAIGSTAAFAATGATAQMAIAGVILHGFGMGATIAVRSAAFSDVFGGANFGSIFGVLAVAYPLGGILPIELGGISVDRLGTYWPVYGLVMLAVAVWGVALVVAGPRRHGRALRARLRSAVGRA